jgi:hypothetical protein
MATRMASCAAVGNRRSSSGRTSGPRRSGASDRAGPSGYPWRPVGMACWPPKAMKTGGVEAVSSNLGKAGLASPASASPLRVFLPGGGTIARKKISPLYEAVPWGLMIVRRGLTAVMLNVVLVAVAPGVFHAHLSRHRRNWRRPWSSDGRPVGKRFRRHLPLSGRPGRLCQCAAGAIESCGAGACN